MKLSAFEKVTNEVMGGNLREFLENKRVVVWDLENDNLLFGLKRGWCAVATDYHTGETKKFVLDNYAGIIDHIKQYDVIAGHNILGYDLFALGQLHGTEFSVLPDSFDGKELYILDTLVMSKLLNPDRAGGHSLDAWGLRLDSHKIDFNDFSAYSPAMLVYCEQDVNLNCRLLSELVDEWGDHDWWDSYELEKAVWEIITRQGIYGFNFNQQLAQDNVIQLDELKETAEGIVLPKLPPRQLPTSRLNMPPKKPFKNDKKHPSGVVPAANTIKKFGEDNLWWDEDKQEWMVRYPDNSEHILYLVCDYDSAHTKDGGCVLPLETHEPMPMSDTSGIKEFLMSEFGWEPTGWKEKDLTVDPNKRKLSKEKYIARVNKYCDECLTKYPTLGTHRVARTKSKGVEDMRAKLLKHNMQRPLKVITQPLFNDGQDKEALCPALERLGEKVEFVKDLILWLTYRHRRNFILSTTGKTGLLVHPRLSVDGRLPSDADTIGASTGRMTHKVIANVPRVTSVFGSPMRDMFIPSEGMFQIGIDLDSIEAKIEGHYTMKYKGGEEYASSLTMEKPNDIHSVNARKLGIPRDDAKKLKYSISYGAQVRKLMSDFGWEDEYAQKVFDNFWNAASPLKNLKINLAKHWKLNKKVWIRGLDGRKLMARSEHSLLNLLFQGAAAIHMKRSMVMFDKLKSESGLSIKQLICYHDELQLEDHKKNFSFKFFQTEEECTEWKKEQDAKGEFWSDVGQAKDGRWFVGYNEGARTARQAMLDAGGYYNLAVETTAGYIIGQSWGDTH